MKKKEEKKREKAESEQDKEKEDPIVSEELIRWMTEGTNTNVAPRSDCG
jgi:hypothetical protein